MSAPDSSSSLSSFSGALRVLMTTQRSFPYMGGVETHVFETARRMVRQGVQVTVLSTDVSGKLPPRDETEGVQLWRVPGYPANGDLYFAPELYRTIAANPDRWDLIHCQGIHTFVPPLAMLAAQRHKIPYVLSFHSGGHSSSLRNAIRRAQMATLRPLLARAQKLIAVSQFEAHQFQDWLRLPASQFVVVPNGSHLDVSQVSASPEIAAADTSKKNGLRTLLSVGRLEKYKGHHRIIEAMPAMLAQDPNVRLRIVGAGPYEAELQQLVHQLGLEDTVRIGAISPSDRGGMAAAMNAADLVILLSEYEAHPIAVMEALSLRRPVLVTHTSGLGEIADKGLVQSIPLHSTTLEVADAILEQLRQPLVPQAITLPTWDDCVSQLLSIYRATVDARLHPAPALSEGSHARHAA